MGFKRVMRFKRVKQFKREVVVAAAGCAPFCGSSSPFFPVALVCFEALLVFMPVSSGVCLWLEIRHVIVNCFDVVVAIKSLTSVVCGGRCCLWRCCLWCCRHWVFAGCNSMSIVSSPLYFMTELD